MNGIQDYRLTKEEKGIRQLIWILQIKQACMIDSPIRKTFNEARDKQIMVLKNEGYVEKELWDKAKQYECVFEMYK